GSRTSQVGRHTGLYPSLPVQLHLLWSWRDLQIIRRDLQIISPVVLQIIFH
ncbi:Isoleucine--tRNA ligase, partial [Clarias magur]